MSLEGDYSGSTFIRTLLPTTIQPMFDLGFNRNFFGQSITKESFDESTPSSQLGKTNVSPVLRTMAETFPTHYGVEGMNLKAVLNLIPIQQLNIYLNHIQVDVEDFTWEHKIGTKFV